MAILTVNGVLVQGDDTLSLLTFLRETLGLTAAKDGCSEGVCGACTILVDDKKVHACTQTLAAFAGRSITTVEGLSQREKEVYVHCFGVCGGVQCGFCTPGMVLSAKALLAQTLTPTRTQVKGAIQGNLCRCTGYQKIEDAILLAAHFFQTNQPIPTPADTTGLNCDFIRPDVAEKVLGSGVFVDDMTLPGMRYAKAVRSRYPRARVDAIHLEKAIAHPHCVKILTASDVPFNKTGHIVADWDVMIAVGDTTRYIGDAIALVCTDEAAYLDEVCALVQVDYTPYTPITSPQAAMAPDAPLLHPGGNVLGRVELERGAVEAALAGAAHVVTRHYTTPFNDHAFLEPECAIAMPDGAGGLHLFTGSQSVYDERHEIAKMLCIPEEKVRCQSQLVGGGFGGKEDMSVQHHAALMAFHIQAPVKVKFTRQESLLYHTKRHPMEMDFTTACDKDGKLVAMRAVLIADTGAYASLGGPVLHRACTHAAGPYNYQNIHVIGMSVYTNNVVAGAYRGFGVTQSCFATEHNIDLLAELVGISPWEIRHRNAIRPGQTLPNGQIADESCAMVECLEAVRETYESNPYAGIACAFKNSGTGMGKADVGRCTLAVRDGRVHIRTSAACMGQGIATMCTQMVCHVTALPPDIIYHARPDTQITPNAGTSTASRQTVLTGEATRRAAVLLKEALSHKRLAELEGEDFYGEFSAITDPMGTATPNPVSHVSYSYGVQVVVLDERGKVTAVEAAYDVGTPVNIKSVEGQIEGGIVMGLGFALTEDYPIQEGYPQVKLATLGLLRAKDVPPITVKLVTPPQGQIPYAGGAKGVGELCLIPTCPACAHAYYRLDGKERTRLPLADTYYKKS